MSLFQAILMGIIQGLTEFLPVSSSGHLALFKILFHVETETGMLFDVLLHAGTLIAIFAVYYKDIWKMFLEGCGIVCDAAVNTALFFNNSFLFLKHKTGGNRKKKEKVIYGEYRKIVTGSYRKFVLLILISTVPTGIIGIFGKNAVELAQEILIVPGICLLITAVLLFAADKMKGGDKLPKDITYTNAFGIGIAQGIATLPGLSRSGTTITACLFSGFNRSFAVKYSFLMSVPAILGAMILELKDFSELSLDGTQIFYYAVGTAVAAFVGYICIKMMLIVVRKKSFRIFSVYCLVIGLVSIIGYFYIS